MTPPFARPARSPQEVAEHNDQRLAQAVARRLEGIPDAKSSPFPGGSSKALGKHRIQEIKKLTDVGWGSYEAISRMKDHANEAVSTIAGIARAWNLNTQKGGVGGWNNLTAQACKSIGNLRSRVDPTIFVAKAEFDPQGVLGSDYAAIEAKYLGQVAKIQACNAPLRKHATSAARSRLRQQEIGELQDVLDSFAEDVRLWRDAVHAASKEVGF